MRVENVKGAVWTCDEIEFYKRRPQRCTSSNGGASGQQVGGHQGNVPEGGAQHPIGYVYKSSKHLEEENFVDFRQQTFPLKNFLHFIKQKLLHFHQK
jgi:hypothetical protein